MKQKPRSVQVQLGTEYFDWMREALERLAHSVIDEDETGQRGARLSPMIQMLASAYITNSDKTVHLLRQVKEIVCPPRGHLVPQARFQGPGTVYR